MAGKFGGFDEEEEDVLAPKEPQVTSNDPGERKMARALRIKKRQEALKRAEQTSEETFKEEEPGLIEQATSAAAEELQRLALEGAAKVTNVKVTTDEREVIRRALFADTTRESIDKIEAEAAEAQTQYEVISSNWDRMLAIKDPLDIDEAIGEQKKRCDNLLEQKNKLIDDLKQQLKRMDESYYEDLEKQDNDIKELSGRIEKQITIMQRAYEKQLSLIEYAIDIEREAMVEHNNKRWEALYKQRDKEEVAHLEYKFEQLEEYKLEVESIMWDHHSKYREAKIELESLIQDLQKELEKLKATCLINTEKIGYNYQVLKKREEENVFVKSEQKRKLNKMSDVANKLRAKIRKAASDGAIEEIKADAEVVKLIEAMAELEKKSYQFSYVNNYKFTQVWRMSAVECSNLAKELRQAEVALHAHILAEPPPPPPPPPPKSPFHKPEISKPTVTKQLAIEGDPNNAVGKDKLIRHILQLVADNTGFLVEDRLLKLIEKYELTSRNLCTLDSIFMALEIQAEEDIELLCKVFLNYAFCPICVGFEGASDIVDPTFAITEAAEDSVSHHASMSIKSGRGGERGSVRQRSSVARSVSASTSRSAHVGFRGHELSPEDQALMAEADEIMQKCHDARNSVAVPEAPSDGGSARRTGTRGVTVASQPTVVAGTKKNNPFLCALGHNLEIEPMQVLSALNEFMSMFVPSEKKKLYEIL
ncbi:dynein regulatory complex protein 1 isoform X2 [Leptidea sinapis]|nr:dynein regulatory complex protein 1 isoform X2 [Leptidea sinapis]